MAQRPIIRKLLEAAEDRFGYTVAPVDDLMRLPLVEAELRALQKDHDLLGYTALDYVSGNPQEMKPEERRKWAARARYAWMTDPMAGASVELMNDFVFGRGVPVPNAKDPAVQELIEDFWNDEDNQRVLTSYEAQMALGTDLSIQSNVFPLMFEDGDDGKIKLGMLRHDEVVTHVPDPENYMRVLYYVVYHKRAKWDFKQGRMEVDVETTATPQRRYYEHWQFDPEAEENRDLERPPAKERGIGKVYHLRMNRTSEQVFGTPVMQRTLRWFSAYNEFMAARVDMVKAAAAFFMKRKVKGTPNQLSRLAQKALSRQGDLSVAYPEGVTGAPQSGSILNENENVTHESFKIDSGAGQAAQDALMLRAQVSAATRWPQHYLGDAGSANLATATAMELPVLKAVEARQQVIEAVFRWCIDRVIEKAVDEDRLPEELAPEEVEEARARKRKVTVLHLLEAVTPAQVTERMKVVVEAHEDAEDDAAATQRDLSYEFSMPSPLRRMMSDLVSATANVARTFDPNNTNMELSKVLLGLVLGEAFEMQDPADLVERIFPEGYVDPAVAAAQRAAEPMGFEGEATDGELHSGGDTSLGAKGGSVPAEKQRAMRESAEDFEDGVRHTVARGGEDYVEWTRGGVGMTRRLDQAPETVRARLSGRLRTMDDEFTDEVTKPALAALTEMTTSDNGGGS